MSADAGKGQDNPTLETFLTAPDLAAVRGRFPDEEAMFRCWHDLARAEIGRQAEQLKAKAPERLDCLEYEVGGVRYLVYGVIHGWTGGVSEEYRALVRKSLEGQEHVLYEKMLGKFYGKRGAVEAPDFCVLRRTGQFVLGLRMMLVWPLFLLFAGHEILKELFTKKHQTAEDNDYNNTYYHNIDPELRRGLDGSLPTRLQIEYEMKHWRGAKGFWDMDLLLRVVPRSAYLAEFARAWAAAKDVREVAIVVGDRHLTEVREFLEHPAGEAWIRARAERHARQIARSRVWYYWHFTRYMFTTLLGSITGSLPWIAAAFFGLLWLREYLASGRAPLWLENFFR